MSTEEKSSKQIELLELENTISNKISQTNTDNIFKLLGTFDIDRASINVSDMWKSLN